MDARGRVMVAGFLAGVFVALPMSASQACAQGAEQEGSNRWALKVNETRGPVRAADIESPLGRQVVSEILAGPTNGADAAYLIFTRMPAGSRGPAMFTLPDTHLYLVLEGRMNVQIGTDRFVAEPYHGVVIPAGIPHEVSNAAASETRDTGSAQQMRIDSTLPGSGGPSPHVHKFTQVYFSMDGETTLLHGLLSYPLPKYSIGVIAPGTVHTNSNNTNAIERHAVLLLDEPPDRSEPYDVGVEFEEGFGPGPR